MYFYPRNRYLHVQIEEAKSEENNFGGFILPPDYKGQGGPLQVVKLLAASKNSEYTSDEGAFLVVPSHLVESLEVDNKKLSIVPESAVYGVLVKV